MVIGVQDTLNDRTKHISAVIGAIPDVVHDMGDFSRSDRKVLHDALGRLSLGLMLREVDAYASSEEARVAMRIALDSSVLHEAARALNIRTALVQTEHYAATRASQSAMRAAFDARIFKEVRDTLRARTASRLLLHYALKGAPFVTDAMRTAVDKKVYDEARSSLRQTTGRLIIDAAGTSDAAKQWMLHRLYGDPLLAEHRHGQASGGSAYDDWQDTRIPPREQPRQETTNTQSNDRAIFEAVIAKVSLASAKTLSGMDQAEVVRVVRTIEAVRQKAATNGRNISDREIYLRFAKRSNNATEPNPAHVRATQIVQLLMTDNQFVC